MTANLDQQVGTILADAFRHESRRSFMSRLTRGLFALAGVSLPAVVKPYEVAAEEQPAAAQPGPRRHSWEWCGLHGPICAGNCHPTMNGNQGRMGVEGAPMTRWVACCKNPTTNRWHCVRYADYCGQVGPRYGQNCDGKTPSGPTWCSGVNGRYICTDVNVAMANYDDARSCSRGCHPDDIRCEPQE
jgi:hypothetical protein